jgi:hypothetical protein
MGPKDYFEIASKGSQWNWQQAFPGGPLRRSPGGQAVQGKPRGAAKPFFAKNPVQLKRVAAIDF